MNQISAWCSQSICSYMRVFTVQLFQNTDGSTQTSTHYHWGMGINQTDSNLHKHLFRTNLFVALWGQKFAYKILKLSCFIVCSIETSAKASTKLFPWCTANNHLGKQFKKVAVSRSADSLVSCERKLHSCKISMRIQICCDLCL